MLAVGQLQPLVRGLGTAISWRLPGGYLKAHATQCVYSVVVTGLQGQEGAVYAAGIPGMAAAEDDTGHPAGFPLRNGTLHQQLLVLDGNATNVNATLEVAVDDALSQGANYSIRLLKAAGGQLHWQLPDGKTVSCTAK